MSEIEFWIADDIARIRLNRPRKLNAINRAMLAGLAEAVEQVEASQSLRVLVIDGAGERAFSVGADIHEWTALAPLDMWRRWIRDGQRLFDRIAGLRQPVIAALHGFALGGGLELALCADIRIAAAGTRLGFPEVSIATLPGWGGTQRLPELIGRARAKGMIFSGEPIAAETAEGWGLVNEVVPGAELEARAEELAKRIAANAPLAVQFAKAAIDGADGRAGFTLEALSGALAAHSQDASEGLASFREKRPAEYRGE